MLGMEHDGLGFRSTKLEIPRDLEELGECGDLNLGRKV